jgi:nitroimidazol reductase NimA-like FMN-containing flavoprotein (pyridoxamine 5'-phosphate oxidase superfamily)
MSDQYQSRQPHTPTAGRPYMPANYHIPATEAGTLPWRHARARLEHARIYWIATTRPDGRPHVTPVWGIWVDDRLYFDGNPQTRRGRNLAANPALVAHIESGGDGKDVVIVEGDAHEIQQPDHATTSRVALAYAAKYAAEGYAPGPDMWDSGGLYALRPRVAFAWTDLSKDATRWQFDAE